MRPEDIANAIAYALAQPSNVDVNEIILRPSPALTGISLKDGNDE
jgi:NADP-dependent 3-hydroxy acid dehydrogenase YdfG